MQERSSFWDIFKGKKLAWILYDAGNSAFATTVMVAILPVFYADVAAATLAPNERSATWGYMTSFSLLAMCFISPILGAIADNKGGKKHYLAAFTFLGVVMSMGLALVGKGDWQLALLLYFLAFVGYAGSETFYESFLPHVTTDQDINRVSSAGLSVGYLSGGLLLALNILWIQMPTTFGLADAGQAVSASFVSVGVWWAIFALPLFFKVPEPKVEEQPVAIWANIVKPLKTLKEVRKLPNAFMFLLAFWAYSDAIGTIMKMSTTFGKELGLPSSGLIGAILMVQFLGVPFALLFGAIGDRIGVKKGIYITIAIYTVICVLGYFMDSIVHFWALAFLVAVAQGGAQALSRSLFAQLTPKHRSSEFFGFYATSAKMAGVLGPLLFALTSQLTGSSRFSILFLIVFLVVGFILLSKVDIEEGRQQARAAS